MKTCSDCQENLPISSYYRNGKHVRKQCKSCYLAGRKRQWPGRCEDCGIKIQRDCRRCRSCDSDARRGSGEYRLDNQGYRVKSIKQANGTTKWIREHREVMSEAIGRSLLPTEQVHHKNGIRDDNRIENLELWTTSHPAGQRIEDVLSWCDEMILLYRGR
jgi:hypothetical protein